MNFNFLGDNLLLAISPPQLGYFLPIDSRLHWRRIAHRTAAHRSGHTGPTNKKKQQENRTTFFFPCIVCVHAKTQSAQNSLI